jgi:DNA topoisomerase-3
VTPRELTRAYAALTTLDHDSVRAVDTRRELDLRIGAAFTRFQTALLRGAFREIAEVVSFGACQVRVWRGGGSGGCMCLYIPFFSRG